MTEKEKGSPQLPEGWAFTTIRELSFLVTKGSTPTTYGFNYAPEGINFVKVENIKNGRINRQSISEFITEEAYDFLKRSQLVEKDVLFSIAGTIGRVGIVFREDLPANTNQAIAIIRCPWGFIYPRYLGLFLDSHIARSSIEKRPRGIGMNNISLEDVNEISVSLPPLNEQSRIVGKVEKLFSLLDAGVESLRRAQTQLKRYRQAVLKYALDGKLTEEWRESHKNEIESASVLLGRIRKEKERLKENKASAEKKPMTLSMKEDNDELPNGWVWCRLSDIAILITDGKHGDCCNEENSDYYFLSAKDIVDGKLDYTNARQVTKNDFMEVDRRTNLQIGDILLSNSGSIGKIAVAGPDERVRRTTFQKSVAIIKLVPNCLSLDYVVYQLRFNVSRLLGAAQGTAQKNLLLRDLKDFRIAIPPLYEQEQTVEEIEKRLISVEENESVLYQTLRQSELLRRSILKAAFEGKLVLQDPNDEPADKLLERIKAEKAKSKDEKDTNRKNRSQWELSTYVK